MRVKYEPLMGDTLAEELLPLLPAELPDSILREKLVLRVAGHTNDGCPITVFVVVWAIHYDVAEEQTILIVGNDARRAQKEGYLE